MFGFTNVFIQPFFIFQTNRSESRSTGDWQLLVTNAGESYFSNSEQLRTPANKSSPAMNENKSALQIDICMITFNVRLSVVLRHCAKLPGASWEKVRSTTWRNPPFTCLVADDSSLSRNNATICSPFGNRNEKLVALKPNNWAFECTVSARLTDVNGSDVTCK